MDWQWSVWTEAQLVRIAWVHTITYTGCLISLFKPRGITARESWERETEWKRYQIRDFVSEPDRITAPGPRSNTHSSTMSQFGTKHACIMWHCFFCLLVVLTIAVSTVSIASNVRVLEIWCVSCAVCAVDMDDILNCKACWEKGVLTCDFHLAGNKTGKKSLDLH